MADLVAVLAVGATFAAALGGFAWFARRIRRRGLGGTVMGPIDEIWHPAAYRFRHEIEAHEERVVPLPSPGAQLPDD